ncbi:MAG: cbb3-type cytochrome oxidase subunit 3 [Oligoflexia bacterium]|jgi:hypothetical protein
MLSQVASRFPLPWLTVVGLLIFFAVFVGVLIWVNRKGSQQLYHELARAPLNSANERNPS